MIEFVALTMASPLTRIVHLIPRVKDLIHASGIARRYQHRENLLGTVSLMSCPAPRPGWSKQAVERRI